MTIPKREGEFESGPRRRPAGPGEPEERTDTGAIKRGKSWRSRFPGWETYEGQPNDPRFEHGKDPQHDPLYDTRLNPSMVVPRRLGAAVWVLGATIGILLLVLLGWLFFYHFQQPSPRSPKGALRTHTTQVAMLALDGQRASSRGQ
jgi:hypothetical protein